MGPDALPRVGGDEVNLASDGFEKKRTTSRKSYLDAVESITPPQLWSFHHPLTGSVSAVHPNKQTLVEYFVKELPAINLFKSYQMY